MNKIYTAVRIAQVTKIIDGDTLDLEIKIDLGFHSHAVLNPRVRLARIDAPEVRGKQRPLGLEAKAYVEAELNLKMVSIKTFKDDSFGRWIAEIYYTNNNNRHVNLSDEMVKAGHAVYKDY